MTTNTSYVQLVVVLRVKTKLTKNKNYHCGCTLKVPEMLESDRDLTELIRYDHLTTYSFCF